VRDNHALPVSVLPMACAWLTSRAESWPDPARPSGARLDADIDVDALIAAMGDTDLVADAPGWEITEPARLRKLAPHRWAASLVLAGLTCRTRDSCSTHDRVVIEEVYHLGSDNLVSMIQHDLLDGALDASGALDDRLARRLRDRADVARETLASASLPSRCTSRSAASLVVGLQHPCDLARSITTWFSTDDGTGILAVLADALADDLPRWDGPGDRGLDELANLLARHGSSASLPALELLLTTGVSEPLDVVQEAIDNLEPDATAQLRLAAAAGDVERLGDMLTLLEPGAMSAAVDEVTAVATSTPAKVARVLWPHHAHWSDQATEQLAHHVKLWFARHRWPKDLLDPLTDDMADALASTLANNGLEHREDIARHPLVDLVTVPWRPQQIKDLLATKRVADDLVAKLVATDKTVARSWASAQLEANPPNEQSLAALRSHDHALVEALAHKLVAAEHLSVDTRVELASAVPTQHRHEIRPLLEQHRLGHRVVDLVRSDPTLTARYLAGRFLDAPPPMDVAADLLDVLGASSANEVLSAAASWAEDVHRRRIGELALCVRGTARFLTASNLALVDAIIGPLTDRLGDDPVTWRLFTELSRDWNATLAELLDVVDITN
jgi:hypothetical protein